MKNTELIINGKATPYWQDGRGRYGTGESYDWFSKYEDGVETFESEDGLWTCTTIEGGVEILRYDGNETDIIIPGEIKGQKVVSVNSAFDNFYELKSVVVPEGVISIEGAFYGCEGLERVQLPKSLIDMNWAFNCCYSIRELVIPETIKNLSWALQFTKLKEITFPKGTKRIEGVMAGSEDVEYAYIPNTVTDIGEAFADCEKLNRVELEEGITRIDDWAFYNCTSLMELYIPESVIEIGENAVGIMEIRAYDKHHYGYSFKGRQVLPGFIIKGKAGSKAEVYAREMGIEFVEV